jgi:aryl-alcohol dehydrogenase-like predicted oxidoreductase
MACTHLLDNALAGGMLTGKYSTIPSATDDPIRDRATASLRQPRGRMDTRGWGSTLYRYRTQAAQDAISEYSAIASQHGIPLTELSLRWTQQRSLITTTLVGHSSLEQLQQSITYLTKKEPLSEEIMWAIDRVHMKNRLPIFSSDRVGSDWFGSGEIGESIP